MIGIELIAVIVPPYGLAKWMVHMLAWSGAQKPTYIRTYYTIDVWHFFVQIALFDFFPGFGEGRKQKSGRKVVDFCLVFGVAGCGLVPKAAAGHR